MDYYKYTVTEQPSDKRKKAVTKTIFTNDPKEISTAPGKLKHVGTLTKDQLKELQEQEGIELKIVEKKKE